MTYIHRLAMSSLKTVGRRCHSALEIIGLLD